MERNSIHIKNILSIKIQMLALGNNVYVYIIAFHFYMLKAFYPIEIKNVML
jgi:hypothetical protein